MIAQHAKDFTWNRGCNSYSPPLTHGDPISHPLEVSANQIPSSLGRQRCQKPEVCRGGHVEALNWPIHNTILFIGEDSAHLLVVSKLSIARLSAKLNPSKVCGPGEVPNWPLREYSELLTYPVSSIINASLQEQRLPTIWKYADVSPLPKKRKLKIWKKIWDQSLLPTVSWKSLRIASFTITQSLLFSMSWIQFSITWYLIRPPHRPPYTWSTAGLKQQMEIALQSGLFYSIIEKHSI